MTAPLITAAKALKANGRICKPRGITCLEIRDFSMVVEDAFIYPIVKPIPSKYLRKEFQWYLTQDPLNDGITKHAKLWESIRQPDGSFASNYGPYMFSERGGFNDVVRSLKADPDSRQAVVPFAFKDNIYEGNMDQICTLGVFFDIREGVLNMTVIMRSNDVIGFGAPIDWCCFSWYHQMVASSVGVERGEYRHFAHSFHAYEKDWEVMEKIIDSDIDVLRYPSITDSDDLISQEYFSSFGRWLKEVEL